MQAVDWATVSTYVAAGNVMAVAIEDDLCMVRLSLYYASGSEDREIEIRCTCEDCRYLDFRRLAEHEPGSGGVLDAQLRTGSPLIDALVSGALDGRAGSLRGSGGLMSEPVQHLEIEGEVSINLLCKRVSFTWAAMRGSLPAVRGADEWEEPECPLGVPASPHPRTRG